METWAAPPVSRRCGVATLVAVPGSPPKDKGVHSSRRAGGAEAGYLLIASHNTMAPPLLAVRQTWQGSHSSPPRRASTIGQAARQRQLIKHHPRPLRDCKQSIARPYHHCPLASLPPEPCSSPPLLLPLEALGLDSAAKRRSERTAAANQALVSCIEHLQ